eukprot:GEZU01009588.1.p1 GENE.GEZU01009588.1~~GEZU01009588.1.p1  ORF type:complete len:112 (-),score=17.03 GEZU01009588.1:43-378(-)
MQQQHQLTVVFNHEHTAHSPSCNLFVPTGLEQVPYPERIERVDVILQCLKDAFGGDYHHNHDHSNDNNNNNIKDNSLPMMSIISVTSNEYPNSVLEGAHSRDYLYFLENGW